MSVIAKEPCSGGCEHGSSATSEIDIFKAIQLGDLNKCRQLVKEQGSQILYTADAKGHSPLHWASLAGYNDIVKFAIETNAPVSKKSNNELAPQPIHWACVNGHIVTVDILLQNGALIDAMDNRSCTPLIIAAQYGKTMLAGYLIGKGARKDLTDVDGDTALHWACFKGYSELVQLLLYSGFNPRQRDDLNQTPLHLACLSGSLSTVKLIVEQEVDLFLQDNNGKTPLDLATGRGYKPIMDYLKRKMRMNTMFGFWRRIVSESTREKKWLYFYLFSLLGFSYPMYFYHFRFIMAVEPSWNLIFMFLNIVMWYSFITAATKDPGYLQCNSDEYDIALKKVALHKEWELSSEDNPLSRLCHTCRLLRPIRSKHCRICNRCIRVMDHHCHYIHNCIGPNNRAIFLIFFVVTMVSAYIAIYFARLIVVEYGYTILRVLFFILYGVMAPIFTYTLLVIITQISLNLTTNERINILRYTYLRDRQTGTYHNPYDKGVLKNWLEYFHLLTPFKPPTNSLLV